MRVGISGTHGTGKTTLAGALCAHLPGHVTADDRTICSRKRGMSSGSRHRLRITGHCWHARCGA